MTASIDDTKRKIELLLAKAAGTDNDAERDAFTAKAEAMMVKWGIEEAELQSRGEVKPEEIVEVRRVYTGNYSIAFLPFVSRVTGAYGNLRHLQSNLSGSRRMAYIIGHKTDVEFVTTLLDSLEAQAKAALHAWQKQSSLVDMRGWEHVKASRAFIDEFGITVARRLRATREQATAEVVVSSGAELVLASKAQRVEAQVATWYPKLGKARGGMEYSSYGRAAGREAGQKASLGGKALGQTKGIER